MSDRDIAEPLLANGWQLDSSVPGVRKGFRFEDFETAFSFMTEVAKVAESLNHHPDWRNVYASVYFLLTTNDVSGCHLGCKR